MIEDDAVRSFRAGVASPAPDVRASSRETLLAVAAGPRASARRLPSRVLALAAAGVAAGAAVLAVGALDTGGPGVVERAAAALSAPDRIVHVVVTVDDPTGTSRQEAWVRTDGTHGHSVSLSGEPRSDCVGTPTQLRCYDAKANVIDVYTYHPDAVRDAPVRGARGYRADDPSSLADALASGYARELGPTTYEGIAAHAIQLAVPRIAEDGTATPEFGPLSPVLYVDAETALPVGQRFPEAGSTTLYETYEFLPDDDEHAPLLELRAPPDARVVRHPVGVGPGG